MILSSPLKAALMMIVCCAFIAASTFFAKMLGTGAAGEPMHAFQIVAGRYSFAFLALIPVFLFARKTFTGAPWPLYFGRAAFGVAGVAGRFADARGDDCSPRADQLSGHQRVTGHDPRHGARG